VNPTLRRVIFAATVGTVLARLYVLGVERGWALVGPVAVRVALTALAAWSVHVIAHELGHFAAARGQGFEVRSLRFGPVVIDLVARRVSLIGRDLGGSVSLLPRGVNEVRGRLRRVALAGPAVTLALTALAALAWRREAGLGSTSGIALVMGGYVLVTALLPGVMLPRRPPAGTDLEQVLGARWVVAHWTHLAVLQGLAQGRALADVAPLPVIERLLPERRAPLEPLVLVAVLRFIEVGRVADARAWVTHADLSSAPGWMVGDFALTAACFFALIDGDLVLARTWALQAQEHQAQPWFSLLVEAALAAVEQRPSDARARWLTELKAYPFQAVALGANQWVLDRLDRLPTPGVTPLLPP
jgi:hypothetical protein